MLAPPGAGARAAAALSAAASAQIGVESDAPAGRKALSLRRHPQASVAASPAVPAAGGQSSATAALVDCAARRAGYGAEECVQRARGRRDRTGLRENGGGGAGRPADGGARSPANAPEVFKGSAEAGGIYKAAQGTPPSPPRRRSRTARPEARARGGRAAPTSSINHDLGPPKWHTPAKPTVGRSRPWNTPSCASRRIPILRMTANDPCGSLAYGAPGTKASPRVGGL